MLVLYSLALCVAAVAAQFQDFQFTNGSTCPGDSVQFACPAPQVCAYHWTMGKYYCCGSGDGSVCWDAGLPCYGQNGTADTNQISCSSYCCNADREMCTQRWGQSNICWALGASPLANLTEQELNKTYSSLSSANPSATAWSFDPSRLAAATPTTSSSASSSTKSSSSSSSVRSTTAAESIVTTTSAAVSSQTSASITPMPEESQSRTSLSAGAIAGIAIGGVVVVLVLLFGAFFVGRRSRRRGQGSEGDHGHTRYGSGEMTNARAYYGDAKRPVATELPGEYGGRELQGDEVAAQLPTKLYQFDGSPRELP